MQSKPNPKPKVYCDTRELKGHVIAHLDRLGADITIVEMEIGDFCLSDRVGIERKASEDFLHTLIERRELFSQLHDLAKCYDRPVLIVEGLTDEIYTLRRTHPHAIQGTLNTIAVSFRIPILYTLNPAETARTLFSIAAKEQDDTPSVFYPHGKRSSLSPDQQLEYFLSAIPDIGVVRARFLLKHFGTVERIMNATQDELSRVPLMGNVSISVLREFITREYKAIDL